MLAIATQAERLTIGLGKLFAIHGTMIVNAEMAPILYMSAVVSNGDTVFRSTHGIKNIAKNLAPRLVVPVAMALPAAATSMRVMICIDLSLVFEAVKVTMTDVKNVANQTM